MPVVYSLGLDPGACSGVALGRRVSRGQRPELLLLLPVFGSNRRTWFARAVEVMRKVRELVPEDAELRVSLEEPPPASTKGSLKGDKRGQKTWLGIGRYQGLLIAACLVAGLPVPVHVQLTKTSRKADAPLGWTDILGVSPRKYLPVGKTRVGEHRIPEAAQHVQGAREALREFAGTAKTYTRDIDLAEAALIMAAGLKETTWRK
jgi:hypothetical protein